MPEPGRRRLAAVLFSDIKGYSSQMGADEERTLARLREHNAIFREQVARHHGRVVKTVGDAFMVEFGSAVDAVGCALDVQRALTAYNAAKEPADRIEVRIGVHAGDVVVEGEDLFGETVNLAARLEGRAPVGGVCVTQSVFEQVRRRANAIATDLGPQDLKNIAQPVRLIALTPADVPLEAYEQLPPPPTARRSRVPLLLGAVVLGAAVVVGAALMKRDPAPPPVATSGRGGTARVGMLVDRGSFDVFASVYTLSTVSLTYLMEPLVQRTPEGESVEGTLVRWDASPDGQTLTLEVRPGLRFHDHRCFKDGKGRDATAEDVVYSLQLAARAQLLDLPLDGLAPFAGGKVESITGVTVAGPREVKLALTRPAPFADLDLQRVMLLPKELQSCDDPRNLKWPVGTGPFRFASPPGGERLLLVRNEAYWKKAADGASLPMVDAVELRHVSEAVGGVQQLVSGELDLLTMLPDQTAQVLERDPQRLKLRKELAATGLQVGTHPPAGITIIAGLFAISRPDSPLAAREVRGALARSFDRKQIVSELGMATEPFGRFLAPWHLGANPTLAALDRDPEKARALLKAAGFAKPEDVPEITLGVYANRRKAAEVIQSQAGELGLRIRIVEISPENLQRAFRDRQLDAWLGMAFGTTRGSEPWPFLRTLFDEGAASISPGEEFKAGVAKVVAEPDRDRRASLYGQLEELLLLELPIIPIGLASREGPTEIYIASPRIADAINSHTGRLVTDPSMLFTTMRLLEPAK